MVSASGEFRLVHDSGESISGRDQRQDGNWRRARRCGAICGTVSCTHRHPRRGQRGGRERSHGGRARYNGRFYVSGQEGLSSI